MAVVVVIIPVAILLVLFTRSYTKDRGQVDTWQGVADRLGLRQAGGSSSGPRLVGSVRGLPVEVDTFSRRQSTSALGESYTRIRVRFESLGKGLTITDGGTVNRLMGVVTGGHEVAIGDDEFDQRFQVTLTVEDPDRFRAWMTPARVAAIRDLGERHDSMKVTDGEVVVEEHRFVEDSGELVGLVEAVVAAAQALAD